MIPENIKIQHLLKAIQEIDINGVPARQESTEYDLVYGGQKYPPKLVVRLANKVVNKEELWDFGGGDETNSFLINKGFTIALKNDKEIPFFSAEEINNYSKFIKTKSFENKTLFELYGEYISNTIFYKTNYWANNLRLKDFSIILDNRWTKGYGSISRYSWARIFKTNDEKKKVFFTIGVDANRKALVYKLDCKNSGKDKLPEESIKIFNEYVYEIKQLDWQYIYEKELMNYNWYELTKKTRAFILKNLNIYNEAIKLINENKLPHSINNKVIKKRPAKFNRAFKGREIDFDELYSKRKRYGTIGEEMIKKYEIDLLRQSKRNDLADKVRKVKDGEGYDILSFDSNTGNEKLIEIKTTTSDFYEPFYFSANEFERYKKDKKNYFIYRIYNLNPQNKSGLLYIIHKNLETLFTQNISTYTFSPIQEIHSEEL